MKKVEEWREIKDFPSYEVSDFGRVRSKDRQVTQFGHKGIYTRMMKGRILKQGKLNSGYMVVWLCVGGKKKAVTVHRLVAAAFVDGEGNDVNHIDGMKQNNKSENLEWVSRSANITHAYRQLGRTKNQTKSVICIETGETFQSMREAAKKKGVNAISIGHVINGRNKTAGGYTWKRG
jgi:hypothetical protein